MKTRSKIISIVAIVVLVAIAILLFRGLRSPGYQVYAYNFMPSIRQLHDRSTAIFCTGDEYDSLETARLAGLTRVSSHTTVLTEDIAHAFSQVSNLSQGAPSLQQIYECLSDTSPSYFDRRRLTKRLLFNAFFVYPGQGDTAIFHVGETYRSLFVDSDGGFAICTEVDVDTKFVEVYALAGSTTDRESQL